MARQAVGMDTPSRIDRTMWNIELLVIGAMIVFNSVFAGYEIALASVGIGRLHTLVDEGRRGAAAALRMKDHMEASLAVVQLGITLVGVVAAATGGAGAAESIEPLFRDWGVSAKSAKFLAIGLVVIPLTFFTIVCGELVPKVFALRNKEWVCLKLSPLMEWFTYAVRPAVWVLETTVAWIMSWRALGWPRGSEESDPAIQDLHGAATAARISRLIGHREEGIILSASRLASTPVRRVMLPSEYIGMLVVDQSLSEALIAAHQEMHTRFPVTEVAGDPQRILGYVNFKDIVAALRLSPRNPSLKSLIRRIPTFSAETSVADCLEHLMRERNHIALVRDRDSRTIGMITLEDIVEELVGEIHDEFDRLPSHLTPLGEGWIAGGFVSLAEIRIRTGIELEPQNEKPIYTLNDWIVEHLGRPPRGGDEISDGAFRISVRKTRHVLVQEAFLEAIRQPSPVDPGEARPA